jgi:hypothetical protein
MMGENFSPLGFCHYFNLQYLLKSSNSLVNKEFSIINNAATLLSLIL